jgi:hypothetical protein
MFHASENLNKGKSENLDPLFPIPGVGCREVVINSYSSELLKWCLETT